VIRCKSAHQRSTPRQVQEGSWSWKGLPGRKVGLSKDFSRLNLANADICTGTDRRFMDLKVYKTPCNSLYGWPEATIHSKVRIVYQHRCPARPLEIIVWLAYLFSWGVWE